jgi:hypothetical protein
MSETKAVKLKSQVVGCCCLLEKYKFGDFTNTYYAFSENCIKCRLFFYVSGKLYLETTLSSVN